MSLNISAALHTSYEERSAGTEKPLRRVAPRGPLTAPKSFYVQRFSGCIDMQSAPDFAATLDRIMGRTRDCVVLDFSRLDFFGTAGLALLSGFADEAARQDMAFAVVGGRSVTRPIEACGLDATVHTYSSVDEAGSALTS